MGLTNRTPEFRSTVQAIVGALLRATADYRLPPLTPEQVHDWLCEVTAEDVAHAYAQVINSAEFPSPAGGQEPTNNAPAATGRTCAGCGTKLSAAAKFCPECGRTAVGSRRCLNCNGDLWDHANFCPECGSKAA